jgi:hypothetical protein
MQLASIFSVYQGGTMKFISSYLDSHFSENFTIHEVGMKLIPEDQSRIRARLQSLESRAPAISSTQLKFVAEASEIKGELSIIGSDRIFHSEVTGRCPLEIYKYLEKEIDIQLIQWKKTRVLDKYVGLTISERQGHLIGGYAL